MIIVWISFSVFWCPMYNVLYDFVSLCVFLASRLIVPMGAVLWARVTPSSRSWDPAFKRICG